MLVLVPQLAGAAHCCIEYEVHNKRGQRASGLSPTAMPMLLGSSHVARRAAGWDGEHHQEDYSFFALTLVGSVLDIERGPRHAHDGEGSSEWYRCPSSSSSELLDNFGRGGDTL